MKGATASDAFARTLSSGWGSADVGGAWSTFWAGGTFATTDWFVDGAEGVMSCPVAGSYRAAYLSSFNQPYADVAITTWISVIPTGGPVELGNLLTRMQSISTYYLFRVQVETSAALTGMVISPTGATLGSVTIPGITYTIGLQIRVRVQSVGHVHRLKVWKAANAEPANWHLTVTDSTYLGAGWIGVRSGLNSANTNTKPVTFGYDNFSAVQLPDFPNDPIPLTVLAAFGADLSKDPSTWPWTNITSDVRVANAVRVTQGRADETSQASPAQCDLELNNTSMAYSAYNPASPNYPNVKRNTPIWVIVDPATRFFGYANGFTPSWDGTGKMPIVKVSASGILRRLMQGNSPLHSPMYRAILAAGPVAYWSLEDKGGRLASALPGVPPMATNGTIKYASNSEMTGSQAAITLTAGSMIQGNVAGYVFSDGNWQVDWYQKVPAAPASETVLMQVTAGGGTVARWEFVMGGGGSPYHALHGYDGLGNLIADSGHFGLLPFQLGTWTHMRLMVKVSGGTVTWQVVEFPYNSITGGGFFSGTFSGAPGNVVGVGVPASSGIDGISFDHIAIFDKYNFSATDRASVGYGPDPASSIAGELATDRLTRLCAEEGVPITIIGSSNVNMGPQSIDTFINLLRECEKADGGLLLDGLGPGLTYITRSARYNQAASLTLDMGNGEVDQPFAPVDDDQRNRNLWKIDRKNGSSATFEDSTGPLGTDPLLGIGVYDSSDTLNLADDSTLSDQAAWRVHLGTVEGLRYPSLNLDLAADPSKIDDFVAAQVNSRWDVLNVSGVATGHLPGVVEVMEEGYTETLGPFSWKVAANCSPYWPWRVFVLDDPVYGKLDTAGCVLGSSAAQGATSLSAITTSGPPWTIKAADFPFDLSVGGWQVTATGAAVPVLNANPYFETDASNWTPAGCTIARSTAQAHQGSASLLITPNGTSATAEADSEQVPVSVGHTYTASAWVYCTVARTAFITINWFDSTGAYFGTAQLVNVSLAANTWTLISQPALTPAGTAKVGIAIGMKSTPPASNLLYIDEVKLTDPATQTFTVSALPAAVAAGAPVKLWRPAVLAL